MPSRARRSLVAGIVIAAALAASAGAFANSSGAPASAANNGCTCHAAQPASSVTVELAGLPAEYTPGEDYALTFTLTGPAALPIGQNTGGFMVLVDAGTLMGASGVTQGLNETTVTHSSSGNNQRSWGLTWSAPTGSNPPTARFWFAGNAVNGDLQSSGDAWNRGEILVPPAGGNNTTSPTQPGDGGDGSSPGAALLVAAGALVVAAAWRSRRRALPPR